MKIKSLAGLLTGTLALVGLSTMASATIINSYDFNSNFSDTLGNGLDLTASGGTVSGGRYSFNANQGLSLANALSNTTEYGIEIGFQMNDNLSGYNKILDFRNLGSDHGLYVYNGAIDFYTIGPNAGRVTLDTDFTIGLERSLSSIEVFLNGTSLFTAADLGGQALSPGNILNFFEDDYATGQRESFVGSVDFIRIHDDASTFGTAPAPAPASVPEPATATLLFFGTSIAGLAGTRIRRKKK